MRVYSGDQLSFFFEVVSVFFRFFFFSFSSLPKKKVGGKLSPGVAEGRGSDQKVGPRAGDEAQGVVSRLGVPVFEIFEIFFEGEEEREKREERGELGEKITGPRLSRKKTRRRRKNSESETQDALPEVDVGVVEDVAVEVEVVEALFWG